MSYMAPWNAVTEFSMTALAIVIAAAALAVVNYYFQGAIMSALDNLRREVEEARTASQSAVTLIQGLKARLDDAVATGDMAEVQALADQLDADSRALADAVTANTPAEQEPTEPTPAPIEGNVGGDTVDENGNPVNVPLAPNGQPLNR